MARRTAGRPAADAEAVIPRVCGEDLPPFRPANYVPRPAAGWDPVSVWTAAHAWAAEHDTKALAAWHAFASERHPNGERVRPRLALDGLRMRAVGRDPARLALGDEPAADATPALRDERARYGF